jgi:CheY-like chemotaxis protein
MPDSPAAGPRAGLRVLVVDDDADCVFAMAALLRLAGHEVHTARASSEALEVAQRLRPDVVLLDLGLPGMNGCEVARQMQKHEDAPPPFLIAVTGHGREEARRRSRDAGIPVYLLKPVDGNYLLEILACFSQVVEA